MLGSELTCIGVAVENDLFYCVAVKNDYLLVYTYANKAVEQTLLTYFNERAEADLMAYSTKAVESDRVTYSTNAVEADPDVLVVAHSKSTLPMNSNEAVGSHVTSGPVTYSKTAKPELDD